MQNETSAWGGMTPAQAAEKFPMPSIEACIEQDQQITAEEDAPSEVQIAAANELISAHAEWTKFGSANRQGSNYSRVVTAVVELLETLPGQPAGRLDAPQLHIGYAAIEAHRIAAHGPDESERFAVEHLETRPTHPFCGRWCTGGVTSIEDFATIDEARAHRDAMQAKSPAAPLRISRTHVVVTTVD